MTSVVDTKTCTRCGEAKPLDGFYPFARSRDGRMAACKECEIKRTRAIQLANPERTKEIAARSRLRTKYGLTNEQLNELEAVKECEVCHRTVEEVGAQGRNGKRLFIDHNHATGKVRGVLCKHCNSALGLAGDDPERLIALASYLIERS